MRREIMDNSLLHLDSGGVKVIGEPLHKSKSDLRATYEEEGFSDYIRDENKLSVGSYYLHDPTNHRLITSPGFAGGRIFSDWVSNTLAPILREKDSILLDSVSLQRYLKSAWTDFWPYSSLFQDIQRLPPGSIIQYENEATFRCYITPIKMSFGEALEKSVAPLQNQNKITLMYSGGVDSTALYAALRSELADTDTSLSIVAVDIGPSTNSTSRAKKVGGKFEMEVETLEFGWPPKNKKVWESIVDQMEQDITNPFSPHQAFATRDDTLVVSGQNFDAMLTGDMHRPQVSMSKHIRWTGDIVGTIRQNIQNITYTARYQNSNILQVVIPKLFERINSEWTAKPGLEGYLQGIISTNIPNLVDIQYDTTTENMVRNFLEEHKDHSIQMASDILNYYQYQYNANQIICSQPVKQTNVYLPAMWAPFGSRNIGRARRIREAFNPKPEVYNYVRENLGKKYQEVAYNGRKDYKKQLREEENFKSKLEVGPASQYIDLIDKEIIKSHAGFEIHRIIDKKATSARHTLESEYASYGKIKTALRIMNLSVLLNSAGVIG